MKPQQFILLLFSISFIISCATANNFNEKQRDMAFELCQMYGFDQGIRDTALHYNKREIMPKVDSLSFKKLMSFIKENGCPNEELLGEYYDYECVELAAAAILLHNPHRIVANDENAFNLLLSEVNKGRLDREFFATVLDKYYWMKKGNNRKVYYGTPFGVPCFQDREKSDSLRQAIGLPPLGDESFKLCDD